MTSDTSLTVPTPYVETEGIRFAYRRWGKPGGFPLVFMNYFTGNLDDWDPLVTDGFAIDHDVVLFDNAGVGSSGGETPNTVSEMRRTGGAAAEVGIDDDFIREVEVLMKPGTCALFVLEQEGDLAAILKGIEGLGGTVLKTNVNLERAKLIQSTLAAATPGGP